MSLAENLLNSLDETSYQMRIAGSVQEEHIKVGQDRVITVPNALKNIAVKGDKDIETVTFDCVRYWDGHDLSTFAIYINYILPNGDEGTYIPESITRSEDVFSFDWEIGSEITYFQGKLTFWIVAKLTDDSGVLIKQWSSFQNSDCTIAQGGDKIYVPEKQTDQDVISQAISISRESAEIAKKEAKSAKESADLAVLYNGKSAYAYAKEGGYTGTEAEFGPDINPDNIKAEVTPVKGKDYFTEADKAEIAEMVDGATVVQAPKYVNSVDEMTDTERVYVMASTGKIWAYMDTSVEKEVTITDELDDTTYYDGCRLGSSATSLTDGITNDANGYHVTPLIDLTKEEYQGKTITIHLEGGHYVSQNVETWIQNRYYKTDGSIQYVRGSSSPSGDMKDWKNAVINIESENSATITINMPLQMGSASVECGYLRFCGQGAVADSHIYITYQGTQTVTGYQWFDTGKSYSPAVSDEDMTIIAEQAAAIVDNNLLSVIGSGEVSV